MSLLSNNELEKKKKTFLVVKINIKYWKHLLYLIDIKNSNSRLIPSLNINGIVFCHPKNNLAVNKEVNGYLQSAVCLKREFHASGPNNELIMIDFTGVVQNCCFNGVLNFLGIKGINLQMLSLWFDDMNKTSILWISHLKVAESCFWPKYEPSNVIPLKSCFFVTLDTSDDWMLGLKFGHQLWPWPWPWPLIFKLKY